jgi:hypothetical protein
VLLDAGYAVTLAHTAAGRDPRYATQLRHMGVQVLPDQPASQWRLSHKSKCMFDVIVVARTSVFEATQGQLVLHCPGVPLVFDAGGLGFVHNSRVAIAAAANSQVGALPFAQAHALCAHAEWGGGADGQQAEH